MAIIWFIESIVVVGFSVLISIGKSKVPFCEHDNIWFDQEEFPAFGFIADAELMRNNLESVNENSFDDLAFESDIKTNSHSLFTLYSSDKGENYLSIENNFAQEDKKGEIDFNEENIVEYISLNQTLKNKLA